MKGPYSRVYWTAVDDPMFADVWANDRALAAWLRMLVLADQCYPSSAPMPSATAAVRLLVDAGLVIELPGNRYTIRGLEKERAMRSQSGRNAAAVRWQSEGNPRREEKRREEKSRDATHRGQHPDCLVCLPLKETA